MLCVWAENGLWTWVAGTRKWVGTTQEGKFWGQCRLTKARLDVYCLPCYPMGLASHVMARIDNTVRGGSVIGGDLGLRCSTRGPPTTRRRFWMGKRSHCHAECPVSPVDFSLIFQTSSPASAAWSTRVSRVLPLSAGGPPDPCLTSQTVNRQPARREDPRIQRSGIDTPPVFGSSWAIIGLSCLARWSLLQGPRSRVVCLSPARRSTGCPRSRNPPVPLHPFNPVLSARDLRDPLPRGRHRLPLVTRRSSAASSIPHVATRAPTVHQKV